MISSEYMHNENTEMTDGYSRTWYSNEKQKMLN